MFVLPNDLNKAIEDMENSVLNNLDSDNSRLILNLNLKDSNLIEYLLIYLIY